MDFAISSSLVRPGRPRYPIFVHRAAALLHASFRPRLATTPLRFANPSPPSGWIGRDRDTAGATLGPRLGCFGVSAVRARLALSIAHVSVRPPCHPGQSHLASPVGDHDCPSAVFPVWRRLKRSLAYPHATQVYCTVRWRCALPNITRRRVRCGCTSSIRHDREPLRTLRALPFG
jgi:hypothetical protein